MSAAHVDKAMPESTAMKTSMNVTKVDSDFNLHFTYKIVYARQLSDLTFNCYLSGLSYSYCIVMLQLYFSLFIIHLFL